MLQIIKTTDEQKFQMYNKLTKKELIVMLIEANKHLSNRQPITLFPKSDGEEVPYNELCSCNPKNGGSGICGCTMANQIVRRYDYTTEYLTELKYNSAEKE